MLKEPKWQEIADSAIWQMEIKPWLEGLRAETLEALVTTVDVGEAHPSLRTFDVARGRVGVLTQLINAPDDLKVLDREQEARENEDEAIRIRQSAKRRSAF